MFRFSKKFLLFFIAVLSLLSAVLFFVRNKNFYFTHSSLQIIPQRFQARAMVGIELPTESTKLPLKEIQPSYKLKSYYVLELGNIPIGLASASVNNKNTGFDSDYYIQLASRVGVSPLISTLQGQMTQNESAKTLFVEQTSSSYTKEVSFKEAKDSWSVTENSYQEPKTFNSLQSIFPIIDSEFNQTNTGYDKQTTDFFYRNPESESPNKIFIPFANGFYKESEYTKTKYDSDGFLKEGIITLKNSAVITFKRIEEEKYKSYANNIPNYLIDFGWIASSKNFHEEQKELDETLTRCTDDMKTLTSSILKQVPQASYLVYRRLINMDNFCKKIQSELLTNKEQNKLSLSLIIAENIKSLLKENYQELPHTISRFPDMSLFYNDTVSYLWPAITRILIQNAVYEVKNLFKLDLNRKSLLSIQPRILNLQRRSVVRADINQVTTPIKFVVERTRINTIEKNTLSHAPKVDEAYPSFYLDGQFFASNSEIDAEEICSENAGKIGIDLGDGPKFIVSAIGVRGLWDIPTKIQVARLFAMQASLAKSCQEIHLRTPSNIEKDVQAEITQFKNESLSLDHELLLSNFIPKKLWVLPGKYKIVLTSIVTGETISAQEFDVGESTQTAVMVQVD